MFVKALCGEEVWDDSLTWLDGDQLRPRVQYVLSSGSLISIGRCTGQILLKFPGHARWSHPARGQGESTAQLQFTHDVATSSLYNTASVEPNVFEVFKVQLGSHDTATALCTDHRYMYACTLIHLTLYI